MYEAKRIMTREVVTVKENTPIYDAMNLLIKHAISGLPVVDDEKKLIGVITEKDMIQILTDESIKPTQTVGEFMTREVKSFRPDTSPVEMAEFFSINPLRRAPVIDDEGTLIGVIARRDILSLILEIRGQSKSL
jgi:CBS domain-containing protein